MDVGLLVACLPLEGDRGTLVPFGFQRKAVVRCATNRDILERLNFALTANHSLQQGTHFAPVASDGWAESIE
jgi:hypothetical protein